MKGSTRKGVKIEDITRPRRLERSDSSGSDHSSAEDQQRFKGDEEWFEDAEDDEELQDIFLEKHLGRARMRRNGSTVSCPSCFTILAKECQMHESVVNRFRALAVEGCTADLQDERIEIDQETQTPSDKWWPLRCNSCNLEVGALDSDSVYHLYNVIPES